MEKMKFEEIPQISDEIKKAVEDMGFEEMTPIQQLSIPLVYQGLDIVGQAQTGTGKTAAFGIPTIDAIDADDKRTQALILCPTRELALQVSEEISKLAKYKRGIKVLPVFGGQSIDRQIQGLKRGAQIVIGTPGRIMDHLRRRTLKIDQLNKFILDEADEMLNMGFREDIETILESVEHEKQTLLFSATMPKAILEIINTYQNDPQIVKVEHKELTTPNVEQFYLETKEKDKMEVMTRLIDVYNPNLAIIFCNTKRKVDDVTELLQTRGYSADKIHGDMKQMVRSNVIAKFKRGDIDILIATDVAARGLDIDDVAIVLNYDMPSHEEYYVHRIGRTGRAGRTGTAFTMVTPRDYNLLKSVMNYTKKKIKRHPIPSIGEIETVKTDAFVEKIKSKIQQGGLERYIKILESLLETEDYQAIEVAAALIKEELELPEKDNVDMRGFKKDNLPTSKGSKRGRSKEPMAKLFINVGKNHQIRPGDVVGSIAGETGVSGSSIGSIDIFDDYTYVEIPEEYADQVLEIMSKNTIKGTKINIERAKAVRKTNVRGKRGSQDRFPKRGRDKRS
ncbi:DEAD/DEAH box helicase [Alkalibacter rhizosphaerae]|uniref:DEAD/DEAH box helicase n=1 Tax=Alkalibacter rhizosphaerae TaxID=2815577 RepID=A0A974XF99_9FIRM|nr:DEAD/DEAH box helicase [Alkalibacter rhizosphaerae]QSX07535.1 DEAD/DEAH box helicase [Alkalibacter rhizosphaerae]